MRKKVSLSTGALLLACAIAGSAVGGGSAPDDFTLDGAMLGKQLTGPTVTLEDCENRVSVFFIWGLT
jgi:hypothetical protein